MHWSGSSRQQERGATSLEFVGIAVAVAALVAALGTGAAARGGALGGGVAERVLGAVRGAPGQAEQPARARPRTLAGPKRGGVDTTEVAAKLRELLDGRRRWWRDRHWSAGQEPARVTRDDLRLTPVIDPLAVWSWQGEREGTVLGVAAAGDVRVCSLCAALEWTHAVGQGGSIGPDGAAAGVSGEGGVSGRLALASAEVGARAEREFGPLLVGGAGRVRGTVGTEADADAELTLGRALQELALDGGAMAGAAARAEGQVGAELLGVAVEGTAKVEGWAGAGIRGTASLRHEDGRVSWTFGGGAALGLGGAAQWSGSLDVSDFLERHGRLARDALGSASRLASAATTVLRP